MKKLITILVVIVVLFVIVSMVMSSSYDVMRSTTINAPVEKVFDEVNNYANMEHWSPWKDYDPNMETIIEGNVGEPGYKFSWSSKVEQVGNGSLTRKVTETNKRIEDELFFADFNMKATAYWNFEQTASGVLVNWGNKGDIGFIWRIPMSIMNMEKQMSPDLEKGLSRLKEYCETNARAAEAEAAAAMNMNSDSTAIPDSTSVIK